MVSKFQIFLASVTLWSFLCAPMFHRSVDLNSRVELSPAAISALTADSSIVESSADVINSHRTILTGLRTEPPLGRRMLSPNGDLGNKRIANRTR